MIRHTAEVTNKERKVKSAPEIIAPSTLVAAKATPNSITAVKSVPNMPAVTIPETLHIHSRTFLDAEFITVKRITPRYKSPTPKATHKNGTPIATTPVKVSTPATIPTIRLAATDRNLQSTLLLQLQSLIIFTPVLLYEEYRYGVNKQPRFANANRGYIIIPVKMYLEYV